MCARSDVVLMSTLDHFDPRGGGGSDHLGPKRKDQGLIGPWLNEGSLDHLGPSRGALCPIAQDASPDRTRHLKECFGPF